MYSLVRFSSSDLKIYKSHQIIKTNNVSLVTVKEKAGRYEAQILAENDNRNELLSLIDDLCKKRFLTVKLDSGGIEAISLGNQCSTKSSLHACEDNKCITDQNMTMPNKVAVRKKLFFPDDLMPNQSNNLQCSDDFLSADDLEITEIIDIDDDFNISILSRNSHEVDVDLSITGNSNIPTFVTNSEDSEVADLNVACTIPGDSNIPIFVANSKDSEVADCTGDSNFHTFVTNSEESEVIDVNVASTIPGDSNIPIFVTNSKESEVTDCTGDSNFHTFVTNSEESEVIDVNVASTIPGDSNIPIFVTNSEETEITDCVTGYSENEDNDNILSVPEVGRKRKHSSKQHCCLFCGLVTTHLPRHLKRKHCKEPLVIEALHNIECSDQTNKNHGCFEKIRKMGDDKYNSSTEENRFIVVRESNKDIAEYVSCTKCNGYYSAKNFRKHRTASGKCSRSIAEKEKNLLGLARVKSSRIHAEASDELRDKIFPTLTKKHQTQIIFHDPVLILWGNYLTDHYMKNKNKERVADAHKGIAAKLRLAADILICAKEIDSNVKDFHELIDSKNFELTVKAVQRRAKFHKGNENASYPALDACTTITKITRILKSCAIINSNEELIKRYEKFEFLWRESQNRKITKFALDSLTEGRRKKQEILPTTKMINHLLTQLESEFRETFKTAKNVLSAKTYCDLVRSIVAYLMCFNRKRPGDVHKTTVDEFKTATRLDGDYLNTLSESERKYATQFSRYTTRGKLNQTASVLVPDFIKEGINFLLSSREQIGIDNSNEFLFANPRSKLSLFIRADESLRHICQSRNLDYARLRATKLRKHLATCTSNLPQDQQTFICDFMGHSAAVHNNIYKIRQVQTDVAVVGRILLDAAGFCSQHRPLTQEILEDSSIAVPNVPWLTRHEIDDIPDSQFSDPNMTGDEVTNIDSLPESVSCVEEKTGSASNLHRSEEQSHTYEKPLDENPLPSNILSLSRKVRPETSKLVRERFPQTWTTPQKHNIRKLFRSHLETGNIPPMRKVETVLAREDHNIDKSAGEIHAWIREEIKRRKREKDGVMVQRWTTPQKHKLREYFKQYYDETANLGYCSYPNKEALDTAVEKVPEFAMKKGEHLRSKLQHEFKRILSNNSQLDEEL